MLNHLLSLQRLDNTFSNAKGELESFGAIVSRREMSSNRSVQLHETTFGGTVELCLSDPCCQPSGTSSSFDTTRASKLLSGQRHSSRCLFFSRKRPSSLSLE